MDHSLLAAAPFLTNPIYHERNVKCRHRFQISPDPSIKKYLETQDI